MPTLETEIFPLKTGMAYSGVIAANGQAKTASLIESSKHSGFWYVRTTDMGNELYLRLPIAEHAVPDALDTMNFNSSDASWDSWESSPVASCPWVPRPASPSFGFIYFIQPVSGGCIKIGFASDPAGRLRQQIQPMSPVELRILGVIPGGFGDERRLHVRFENLRRHGEWFSPDKELVEFIQTVSQEYNGGTRGAGRLPAWRE